MNTQHPEMTAERSLELIRKHIEESRQTLSRQMGKPLLLWGSLVFVTALVVGHLWQHCGGPVWNLLWLAMTAMGFGLNYLLDRRSTVHATGFVPVMLGKTWLTFCFFALGLFAAGTLASSVAQPVRSVPFAGTLALLMGMATAVSGFLLNKRLIAFCGILLGIFCLIADCYISGASEMLLIAGMAVAGLIVPGLYLQWKTRV